MTKQSRLAKSGGIALASSLLMMGLLPAVSAFAASAPTVALTESAKTVTAGGSDTYTATASGITNPEYQFWAQTGNTWTMVRGWSTSNSYTMNNMQDGSTLVTAYAAPTGDLSAATNTAPNGNEDTAAAFVDSSVNVTASASTVVQGQTVTLTATSANIAPALYQFWYETPSGTWTQSGDYGTSNTYTFTASQTGTYNFIAYAKMPDAINNAAGAEYSAPESLASKVSTPGLSSIAVTNATSGTGTESSPAVSLNGKSMTVSTTLTDALGNPIPSTAVTFNVSEYGTYTSTLPTVSNSTGVISGTQGTNAEQYTAYTNSSGVASLIFAGPAGQTYAYEVQATAPYSNASGAVMSTPSYLEFVAAGQAGISPYATSSQPFTAGLNSSVPITVAVPPTASGVAQANVLVKLTTTAGYFTNAAGADLGQTVQVSTNASGLAQTLLSDSTTGTATVTATLPSYLGITNPSPTSIEFAQSGVGTSINNFGITATTGVSAGQPVTISGQLVDATGNPVANGQVLVYGYDSTASGDFGTVVSGTTTDFPSAGSSIATGAPATSSYGTLVTANANGDFSFAVTDTSGVAETATYQIYGVANGAVTSLLTNGSGTIGFIPSTTLGVIALGGTDSQAQANSYTTYNGGNVVTDSYGTVYLDAQNAAGAMLMGQSMNYNVSVSNGGTIEAISGAASGTGTLPINTSNPGLSSLTISEAPVFNTSGTVTGYTVTVPGQSGSLTLPATNPDLALNVYNGSAGSTAVTVTSGTISSTATFTFVGGAGTYVQDMSPSNLISGQPTTVTYTLEDAQGNPTSGEMTIASTDPSDPMWITAVNGQTLQQSENMGSNSASSYQTVATPVPLGTAPTNLGYGSVNSSGLVSWAAPTATISASSPNLVDIWAPANGVVSLTLQGGGVSYYVAPTTGSTPTNGEVTTTAPLTGSGSEGVYTYASDTASAGNPAGYQMAIGTPASSANLTQEVSTINYGVTAPTQPVSTAKITYTTNPVTAGNIAAAPTTGTTDAVSSTAPVVGGTYAISAGPSGYTGVSINSSTGAITYMADATPGYYTVTYTLNGYTEASNSASPLLLEGASSVVPSVSTITAGQALTVTGTYYNTTTGAPEANTDVTVGFDGASATAVTSSDGAFSATVVPTVATSGDYVSAYAGTSATGTAFATSTTKVSVTAAAASKFTVTPATATVANSGTQTVTATVEDAYGNPVDGTTVSFVLESGALGTLSASSATTDASGVATVTYTAPTSGSGTDTVTAAVSGITSTSNTSAITY